MFLFCFVLFLALNRPNDIAHKTCSISVSGAVNVADIYKGTNKGIFCTLLQNKTKKLVQRTPIIITRQKITQKTKLVQALPTH